MKNFFTLMTLLAICSTSLQAQWVSRASGFATPQRGIQEMIAVNSNVVWAMGYDSNDPLAPLNEFTRTTDGGKHWTAGSISAFPDYILIGIAPISATKCYGTMFSLDNGIAKIVKTTDGGLTWTEKLSYNFGESFNFFSDIYFFNANEGIAFGDQSDGYFTIYTTSDGGNNWTRVPQANMPAALIDEASYTFSAEGIGNTFWSVSTSGRVWKTTDKGLHWNAYQTSETSIDYSNLKMRDALHGLWGVHDELYRTDDGAETFTEVEPSGTWFTNDLAFVPGTASTYVSTGGNDFDGYGALHGTGSSYSLDDGNTWITLDTGVEHLSLAMVNSYTGFTGGLNTNSSIGGIYVYNGPALGYACENNKTSMCYNGQSLCVAHGAIQQLLNHGATLGDCDGEKISQAQEGNAMTVSPNPMSELSVINFQLPQVENVSVRIYDVQGRLVATLADGVMNEGAHQLVWNVTDENAGIYFLKMESGDYLQTEKISVIK